LVYSKTVDRRTYTCSSKKYVGYNCGNQHTWTQLPYFIVDLWRDLGDSFSKELQILAELKDITKILMNGQ